MKTYGPNGRTKEELLSRLQNWQTVEASIRAIADQLAHQLEELGLNIESIEEPKYKAFKRVERLAKVCKCRTTDEQLLSECRQTLQSLYNQRRAIIQMCGVNSSLSIWMRKKIHNQIQKIRKTAYHRIQGAA